MAVNNDIRILEAIKWILENKDGNLISPHLENAPDGEVPRWKIKLKADIDAWNTRHPEDPITYKDIHLIDEDLMLERVMQLMDKFNGNTS